MLPQSVKTALREQIAYSRALWEADRRSQLPGVFLPFALEAKYRGLDNLGHGNGYFRLQPCRLIRIPELSAVISYSQSGR
jgi:hypothetical protein